MYMYHKTYCSCAILDTSQTKINPWWCNKLCSCTISLYMYELIVRVLVYYIIVQVKFLYAYYIIGHEMDFVH